MKSILMMRAINNYLRANPQLNGPNRVNLKTTRKLIEDMEARSMGIPETWEKIRKFVEDNWFDLFRTIVLILTLLADERDE
jgi:hypothetical protein